MNIISKCVSYKSLVASFIFLVFPLLTLAQTTPESQDISSPTFISPSFQVGNIQINQNTLSSGTITGTVDIINDNDASFGNIRTQLLLLEPAPTVTTPNTIVEDNARTIDRIILPGVHSFSPKETKTISFTYNAPKLPEGQYRIRLQVITTNGNTYGWDDLAISIGAKDASFLMLSPQPVIVQGENHNPQEGVNVQPGSEITLPVRGTLTGSAPLKATPVLTIYAFDLTGEVIGTQNGSVVEIASGKDFIGEFKVANTQKPGAYQATLAFVDTAGNRVSSLEQYRWVITGTTGRIISAEFIALTDKSAIAKFAVVGSADRETVTKARVAVSLLDGTEVVREETATYPDLGPEGARSATVSFDLDTPLKDPGLRIVLTNTVTGAELDRYEMHVAPIAETNDTKTAVPEKQRTQQSPYAKIAIIALLVILCIAAVAVLWMERRNAKRTNLTLPLLLLVGIVSLGLVSTNAPSAKGENGILIGASAYMSLTINKPIHNNTIPYVQSDIPVSFAMSYLGCNNRVIYGEIGIYNLTPGGKVPLAGYVENSQIDGAAGRLIITGPAGIAWNADQGLDGVVNGSFDQLVRKNFLTQAGRSCPTSADCQTIQNYTGILAVPSSLKSTTLLWAMWQGVQNDRSWHRSLGMYSWVNFEVPSTPTPSPTATPRQTPSPTPTVCPQPTTVPTISGKFVSEKATPKYGKTFISSITCKASNGSNVRIGGTGKPSDVMRAVQAAIDQRGLNVVKPVIPIVRSDGGTGGSRKWNDNGTIHKPTVNAVCAILGYQSYVSSTCLDQERSSKYPNGKCNYHTPENNQLSRFSGTLASPSPTTVPSNCPNPPTPVPPTPTPLPASTVDLKANGSNGPITINSGDRPTLSWVSTNSDWCWAQGWGGWKTPVAAGSQVQPPLTASITYTLRCGRTGQPGVVDTVVVNVTPRATPTPTPTITPSPTPIPTFNPGGFQETR